MAIIFSKLMILLALPFEIYEEYFGLDEYFR
jgi:hypothetical protein